MCSVASWISSQYFFWQPSMLSYCEGVINITVGGEIGGHEIFWRNLGNTLYEGSHGGGGA